MSAFFVLKFYCIPPIDSEDLSEFLGLAEKEVKRISAKTPFPDIPVGIALVSDLSDYQIGDMIWAEGEFRGDSGVRGLTWEVLNSLSGAIMWLLEGFVAGKVNSPDRLLSEAGAVPCSFIAVTIGAENGPITATQSRALHS